jgi:hypothetical protein
MNDKFEFDSRKFQFDGPDQRYIAKHGHRYEELRLLELKEKNINCWLRMWRNVITTTLLSILSFSFVFSIVTSQINFEKISKTDTLNGQIVQQILGQ